LELVQDEDKMWEGRNDIRIYDLCCGKGYLTLALHYYFSNIKGMKTEIEGIDLKEDVIGKLNSIIKKLNLEGIKFVHGDILEAQLESPDMVVALHACDIATDISLAAAVAENTKLIMSVPCCQHELFSQMANEELAPILKYGIMKDKFTELATNALRGLALEASGYNVKMIEFTAVTHTMKNIMIKAVKGKKKSSKALKEYYRFSKSMGVKCSAELILKESKPKIES
jgi:SAM-dependent methyltransferase